MPSVPHARGVHSEPSAPRRRGPKKISRSSSAKAQGSRPTTIRPEVHFIGEGIENLTDLKAEIDQYFEMLLGREPLPIDNGVMSLMESATAMYGRASEITAQIQKAEQEGVVPRGTNYYKFRTGQLRTFMEACSKYIELGSRRVTAAKMEFEYRDV